MQKLNVTLERSVQGDAEIKNYDYRIIKVSDGKNTALIYNHDKVFYNVIQRTPFKTAEECFLAFFNRRR